MQMLKEAFVYCWTDKLYNKLYVGVHKGSTDDGYICSSKIMLKEYKKRPNDFTRQIVAQGAYKEMYNFETKILQSENVSVNEHYYNKASNNGYFKNKGKPLSEEHKKNIKKSILEKGHPFLGKKHSLDAKEKMSKSRKLYMIKNNIVMFGEKHPQFGKKQTLEHVENRIKKLRGKKRPDEIKKKVGHARSGVYEITTPDNKIIIIKNLASFCRENNLSISNMFTRGKSKGFTCKNLHKKEIDNGN